MDDYLTEPQIKHMSGGPRGGRGNKGQTAPLRAAFSFIRRHSLLLLFAFAFAGVLSVSMYSRSQVKSFIGGIEESMRIKLRDAARRLAATTDADELAGYLSAEDMRLEGYGELRRKLSDFAADAGVRKAYFIRVVGDEVRFIADSLPPSAAGGRGLDAEPKKLGGQAHVAAALGGGDVYVSPPGSYMAGSEGVISAYCPIPGPYGEIEALAVVDMDDRAIMDNLGAENLLMWMEIVSLALVFCLGAFGSFKYRGKARAAEQASTAKSLFLSRMSHEIRTPMNAILGMSDLAALNYGKPQGLEFLAHIKHAGNNLMTIINDILDLSAVESGKLRFIKAPYGVAPMLRDVLTLIRLKLAEKKDIAFSVEVDPVIPGTLVGDETRVREILLNMLTNATKYTMRGFIKLRVGCYFEDLSRIVLTFEVHDSGIGIKPKNLESIFQDFSRTDDSLTRNIQGTGLGLSITRLLCRAMGGDIRVESKYGEGSKFSAHIRQGCKEGCAPIGEFDEKIVAPMDASEVTFIAPDFRVLIVDDVVTNLKVVEGLLSRYHMKIDVCQSGRESISLIKRNNYGLLLVDHMMPEMDGFETAAAIRALGGKRYKRVPIVALTANVSADMKEVFLGNGFDDCLAKPIEIPKLDALVEKWLPADKRLYAERRVMMDRRVLTTRGLLANRREASERRAIADRRVAGDRRDETPMGGRPLPAKEGVYKTLETPIAGIKGLDIDRGLAATGGRGTAYKAVLRLYCRDVAERIQFLNSAHVEKDLKGFITQVHALKSASATIGATALSDEARALEEAGLRKDYAYIGQHLDGFRERLETMSGYISEAIAALESRSRLRGGGRPQAPQTAGPELMKLKRALDDVDIGEVDALLEKLSRTAFDEMTNEDIARVRDLVLTSEFPEAARVVSGTMARLQNSG